MFVPTNMVLKRYLTCQTFSKCQPYCNESCLSIRIYTYKIEADNKLHNYVSGALSVKDGSVMNVNTLASGRFRGFSQKNDWFAHGFVALPARNSGAESGRELFKSSKDSAILLV